jgi:ribosomal protein S18 acetylase RimI-like enzyme
MAAIARWAMDRNRPPQATIAGMAVLRRLGPKNHEALAPLLHAMLMDNAQYDGAYGAYSTVESCRQQAKSLLDNWTVVIGAFVDARLVGYAHLESHALSSREVLNEVFVLPGFRRQGIGRALPVEALSQADSDKALEIRVASTNEAAARLYRSLGFRMISRIYIKGGYNIVMLSNFTALVGCPA